MEGERLLLVATHKRVAALNEISRLKTEGLYRSMHAAVPYCARFMGNWTFYPVFRIRIRMNPGFFADPDPNPGFKSPDPDPSMNRI